MELNINSLSARVYREVYNTRRMPESLCPYFWKLVLAYPLVVVLLPLLIPTWIMIKFQDETDNDFPIGAKALMGVLMYGFIFIVFVVGVFISSYWITYYQGTAMYSFYVGGGLITLILGVTGIVIWVKYLIENRKFKHRVNNEYIEEKPNVIIEFIKAKYNRYCPKITWK